MQLGRAILAIGELEYQLLLVLGVLESDSAGRQRLLLQRRLDRLKELLNGRNNAGTARIRKFHHHLSGFISNRHTIAHDLLHFLTSDKHGDQFAVLSPDFPHVFSYLPPQPSEPGAKHLRKRI